MNDAVVIQADLLEEGQGLEFPDLDHSIGAGGGEFFVAQFGQHINPVVVAELHLYAFVILVVPDPDLGLVPRDEVLRVKVQQLVHGLF